jgi:hypothetical protein
MGERFVSIIYDGAIRNPITNCIYELCNSC